jgi:hypothetical protein
MSPDQLLWLHSAGGAVFGAFAAIMLFRLMTGRFG